MSLNKTLFVASLTPFGKGGGAQATMSYLDATLDIFGKERVTVMIAEEADIPQEYKNINYIKIGKRNGINKYTDYLFGYYSRFTRPMIEHLKNNEGFTYCIINGGVPAGKAVPYIEQMGIRTVVIHHNYEVEYHKDNKTIESLHGHFLRGIRTAERTAYKEASYNLFLTRQDIELFEGNYGDCRGKIELLGCFDVKDNEVVVLSNVKKNYDIVMSGSLASFQTTVGIKDFDENYFEIAKKLGLNRILLTGKSPSQEIQRIQNNRPDEYTIIPNPKFILPIVQEGKIYICPTCIGGGLKLRAMDGLKCGLPVLVHEVSARGYDFFYDKPYFKVYNNQESFSKGLSSILDFLNNANNTNEIINRDYYHIFGYEKGVERLRNSLYGYK